jgi:hypothetical protein
MQNDQTVSPVAASDAPTPQLVLKPLASGALLRGDALALALHVSTKASPPR